VRIDTALSTIEKRNPTLKGALPDNYFSRQNLETKKLASLIDTIDNIETLAHETDVEALSKEDLVGRVYEYFLGKFAATEGKGGGEFYTPKCVVTLLTEMLEPFRAKFMTLLRLGGDVCPVGEVCRKPSGEKPRYRPVRSGADGHHLQAGEDEPRHSRPSANLGERPADTFFSDQHRI
jgi:type I restriction enzyme M protein